MQPVRDGSESVLHAAPTVSAALLAQLAQAADSALHELITSQPVAGSRAADEHRAAPVPTHDAVSQAYEPASEQLPATGVQHFMVRCMLLHVMRLTHRLLASTATMCSTEACGLPLQELPQSYRQHIMLAAKRWQVAHQSAPGRKTSVSQGLEHMLLWELESAGVLGKDAALTVRLHASSDHCHASSTTTSV